MAWRLLRPRSATGPDGAAWTRASPSAPHVAQHGQQHSSARAAASWPTPRTRAGVSRDARQGASARSSTHWPCRRMILADRQLRFVRLQPGALRARARGGPRSCAATTPCRRPRSPALAPSHIITARRGRARRPRRACPLMWCGGFGPTMPILGVCLGRTSASARRTAARSCARAGPCTVSVADRPRRVPASSPGCRRRSRGALSLAGDRRARGRCRGRVRGPGERRRRDHGRGPTHHPVVGVQFHLNRRP